jgi:hypothetical protein
MIQPNAMGVLEKLSGDPMFWVILGSASAVWLTLGTLCGLVGITTVLWRRSEALS